MTPKKYIQHDSDETGARSVDGKDRSTTYQYRAVCACGRSSPWHDDRDLALEHQDVMNGGSLPPDGHKEPCCDETTQLHTREGDR